MRYNIGTMITLTYLGHSSFLVKYNNLSFIIDPYQDNSVPGMKLPRVSANYVFTSHTHFDHNAVELVKIEPTNEELDYDTIIVPHDHHNGAKRGLNKMYLFRLGNYRLLFTGDLGCIPDEKVLKQIEGVDVILAPINGFYTISAEELHQIMDLIHPKVTIPIHYYRKENNSGYPDGKQIDIFKSLVGDDLEVNEPTFKIDDELSKNKVVILNKFYQE